ncbi:MAG: hypothetical protein UHG91_09675 [Succinivibrionaceae bacterium]|nr:hypothetical protein [Ruminobacter sp.]MDY5779218.1 hypothetical protein [Succinivibrionaceae bacterium]MEE1341019.1 hypothetical protein [Succinivibrionaceae bacterium]
MIKRDLLVPEVAKVLGMTRQGVEYRCAKGLLEPQIVAGKYAVFPPEYILTENFKKSVVQAKESGFYTLDDVMKEVQKLWNEAA